MYLHGHAGRLSGSQSPEYIAWCRMKSRCGNPLAPDYPRYGGRGIRVCPQWEASFEAFFSYIGPKPTPDHSVDRINNNGNYEPGNVRWATRKEQARNKRNTKFIEWRGRSQLISEWAKELGIERLTLRRRLVNGWPVELAFTTPIQRGAFYRSGSRYGGRINKRFTASAGINAQQQEVLL